MTGTMNNGASGAQMAVNQPTRTSHGANQSKGGNYENPGGNETGTMQTQMNANETGSRMGGSQSSPMNNGGGPEPHQGSNPGAQSDPGPKEVGFYDQASNHVLGDDGIQAAVERPSPMRMGGVGGSQPNPGQRGGQNTGTSGAQTSAYSSPEEYGAGAGGGQAGGSASGARGAGERYTGGIGSSSGAGNGQTGARAAAGGGSMGSETRNPVGFASGLSHDAQPMHEPGHSAYVDELGAEGHAYVYQSRAAQKLVDMRDDAPTTYSRMEEPAEDRAPRAADKAGEVADAVKGKAGGFFANAKDKVEGFLDVDLDNDGSIGGRVRDDSGSSYSGGSREMGYERDTPGTRPYVASGRSGAMGEGSGSSGAMGAKPGSPEAPGAMGKGSGAMGDTGSTGGSGAMGDTGTSGTSGAMGAGTGASKGTGARGKGEDRSGSAGGSSGAVGYRSATAGGTSGGAEPSPQSFETREKSPRAFETREKKARGMAGDSGARTSGGSGSSSSTGTGSYDNGASQSRTATDKAVRGAERADSAPRVESRERELVDA